MTYLETLHPPVMRRMMISATSAAVLAATLGLLPAPLQASSHREAPFILKYPQVDATDFYTFNSYEPGRDDYVTFIANYNPTQSAYSGPNYFPLDQNALYEIHIDNDGDAVEDLTFQFDFTNKAPDAGVLELHRYSRLRCERSRLRWSATGPV